MKRNAGVMLGTLALIAGSALAAPPALAEDVTAGTAAAGENGWRQALEARLEEDARSTAASIADDAMAAASRIDLSARLDPADAGEYQVLALANER